jgi:hypothetical protein
MLPKMELRHERTQNSKRNICSYTYNNPASFAQIKEATGLSTSYLRYLINQLKFDNQFKTFMEYDRDARKTVMLYQSIKEYKPIKYVRKTRFEVPQLNKVISDELISTVLERLLTEAPKVIALDLNERLSRIYWIRNKYGNN